MVTIMIFFGILNYNLKDFMAAHKLYYLSWNIAKQKEKKLSKESGIRLM